MNSNFTNKVHILERNEFIIHDVDRKFTAKVVSWKRT